MIPVLSMDIYIYMPCNGMTHLRMLISSPDIKKHQIKIISRCIPQRPLSFYPLKEVCDSSELLMITRWHYCANHSR